MSNLRYDYLPITKRVKIEWPEHGRIALWVAPNIEYFHFDMPLRGAQSKHWPDVPGYSLRDYGSRVGVFRIMDVLDKYRIRASVLLNAEVCSQQPQIIEEGKKRQWEWLGHGMTNSYSMIDCGLTEERSTIRSVKEIIAAATGHHPKGWLSPGLGETANTPDYLAAEGFEYVCDWACDEQPVPMRVKTGRMLIVPYQLGINDLPVFTREHRTGHEYFRMVCDQFDTLYRDSESGGRVLCLPLHPYVIGVPHRIKYLDAALDYICSHRGVWRATGWEIAEWYYHHYYQDPGKFPGAS